MWSGRIIAVPRPFRLRRIGSSLMVSVGLAAATMLQPCAARDILNLALDKATLLKYPASTETIVVGNPIIADVTMLKNSGIVILTGKGFGETNLVFLDRAGTILSETDLRVEGSPSLLTVQRGMDRESYSCHPRCEPSVSLGDDSGHFNNAASEIQRRNELVAPSAAAPIVR